MREKSQEYKPNFLYQHKEGFILVGVGLILVLLGLWSKVPITNVLAFGVGVFIFYTAYALFRSNDATNPDNKENDGTSKNKNEEESFEQKEIVESNSTDQYVQKQSIHFAFNAFSHFGLTNDAEKPLHTSMKVIDTKNELNFVLVKILHAIREACFAYTTAFFWVNRDSQHIVLEAKVTESESFVSERKIALGNDIVSRIGLRGKPEIINDISSDTERDILCYYKHLQDIHSFVGVPVFYTNRAADEGPIGVIAVDSKAHDAFGEETLSVLSHFSHLIALLIVSYSERYELLAEARLLKADRALKENIVTQPTIPAMINMFVEEVGEIVAWESMAVILFDDLQGAWAIASARTRTADKFVSSKQKLDMEESIVGKAIRMNLLQTVNLTLNAQTIFHHREKELEMLRKGFLVIVPFTLHNKCYGALCLTNITEPTGKEISAIRTLSSTITPMLEIAELNSIVDAHIVVDELTGALTPQFFLKRLSEELHRVSDSGEDLSMVLITISNTKELEARYGTSGKHAALANIAEQLRLHVRQYDVVARLDDATFALLLVDTIATDAFLWAEKVRVAISTSVVAVENKTFSISVNIGISGASELTTSEELIANAKRMLEQAQEAGGNIVRVY